MNRRKGFHLPWAGRFLPPLRDEFVSIEALSGIVLLSATVVALVWANVAGDSYQDVWQQVLTIGAGDASISLDLQHWVNDGLMTIFFFVVGLEIKREVVDGELGDRRTAALPAIAALGGMIVPAGLYLALNVGGAGADGWGIPMATDIAFAIGVLALLGSRVSGGMKVFLLTLAIVDDIGAIVVIALFYSSGVSTSWLVGAAGVLAVIVVMRRVGFASPWWYVIPAIALWVAAEESGVHATIAGVALGLLTPAAPGPARGPLERIEPRLHPWSSFVVVPLFALANAGVVLTSDSLEAAAASSVAGGIVLGLVVGKTVGIAAFTALGLRLGWGRLPAGVRQLDVVALAAVAGIGFTVSLFVADLAFVGAPLADAKVGILAASALAATLGAILVRVLLPKRPADHLRDAANPP
jgi:NhaA family Na+:H+ antiporter